MGGKTILLLLVVALGLGAALWFTDEKPVVDRVAEASVLDGRSLTTAKRIRWQQLDRAPIEIGRAPDGRFQIQEPIVDIASQGYMRQIVVAWDTATMRATPLANDDEGRRQAGLTPPQMLLIAEWDDGQRVEVEVGDAGPLGDTRFLCRDGRIWEGGQGLIESMHVGLQDLRERIVFRNAFGTVSEVRVEQLAASGIREALHLKASGNEWLLLEPIEGRADPVAAQRFVTQVLALRVEWFHEGVLRFPEREPEIVLTVRGEYGEEKVSLWLEQGQVYGQLPGRGVNFTSDNNQYTAVFVNAAENLRARILVPMGESTFEELVELVVDPGQGRGDRIRLVRASQSAPWRLVEPIEYAVRATPVSEAAFALGRLVARRFVRDDGVRPRAQDPRYGMVGARWSVSTRRANEQAVHTLWFGGDVAGELAAGLEEPHVFACRSDEPDNVAVVPKQPLEMLQRPWTEYCELEVVKQPATVDRMDLTRGDGETRRFWVEDGTWVLDGTAGSRDEVGDLVSDVLRDLVGRAAVDMRQGFGAPDWELMLKRRNGDELGLVRVWDRGPGELLLVRGRSDQPVGFEVGKLYSDQLRALWK